MYNWLLNDPIGFSVFSLLRNILYLSVVLLLFFPLMRHIFTAMNQSVGITFQEHIWDELKKGNTAVAIYAAARVFGVLVAVGWVASAFLH